MNEKFSRDRARAVRGKDVATRKPHVLGPSSNLNVVDPNWRAAEVVHACPAPQVLQGAPGASLPQDRSCAAKSGGQHAADLWQARGAECQGNNY